MKISQPSRLIISLTALAVSTTTLTAVALHLPEQIAFSRDNPRDSIDEVWQIVERRYVDGSFNQKDWKSVRQQYLGRNYLNKDQVYVAIKEMLKTLGDPYTRFMNPQEFKDFQMRTSGQLLGVGLQLSLDEKTKKLVVVSPIDGTSAAKAGIVSEDIIIKIDGVSTVGMDIEQAVQLIRGQAGTSVTLTIQRDRKIEDYKLLRQQIEIHPVEAKFQANEGDIGYVRLKQFSDKAPDEMRTELKKLEERGARGYIIDVRSNPGGLLYGAIDIARMFLNDGKIVSTKLREGKAETKSANRTAIIATKPIVVLVDEGSASASEILAGALQDNNRAKLVGVKTFGKGLVQSVIPLSDRAGMAVTIAKYYTPNGTDINKKGIQPDVEVKLTKPQRQALRKDNKQIGTARDLQYVKALGLLKSEMVTDNTQINSNIP